MKLSPGAVAAIVAKKSRGAENTPEEITGLIQGYCAEEVDERLIADWLRAVMARGMTYDETATLTDVMAHSGKVIEWSGLAQPLVDKHSTGGVGDDVSLIAVPLAAACGVKVAKLSGGALGHTGGTLDKLECIPGLRTTLSLTEFKSQVASDVGCVIARASEELAPADKKLYALRHRTGTVPSVPLITASVLSKKIAAGAPNLVIDVKAGSCASLQSVEEARSLAASILEVGMSLGKNMHVLLSDMDAPLANSVGDALELAEALATMQHKSASRLRELTLTVATAMLGLATGQDEQTAQANVLNQLQSGAAYNRFASMVQAQGGNLKAFAFARAPSFEIRADTSGFVEFIDGRALGLLVHQQKHQANAAAGVRLLKRRGDRVESNEPIAQAFAIPSSAEVDNQLRRAVRIGERQIPEGPVLLESWRGKPS